jgi:Vitamin K-dependent gamma-carboxylase
MSRRSRVLLVLACSIAAWIFANSVLFPKIIAAIYAGKSLPVLNNMMSAKSLHPLAFYVARLHYVFFIGLFLQIAMALPFLLAPRSLPVSCAIRTAWMRYWFRPTPTIYLGLARIICVGCALALMLPSPYGGFNQLVGLSQLPSAMYHPLLINRIMLLPLGPEFHLSATGALTIFWLTFATGLLALIGFRTNIALLLFTFGYAFLTAYKNSFGDFHQAEPVLLVTIGALAVAPSGRSLSLDAWIESRQSGSGSWIGTATWSVYAAWPLLLSQSFLALVYLDSGIQKLYFSGLEWMNGSTLGYYLVNDGVNRGSRLAGMLVAHPDLVWYLSIASVAFETTFWLVLLKPRLAWVFVPAGLCFHLANAILKVAALWEFMAVYVVFIPQLIGAWRASPFTFLSRAADPETGEDLELAKRNLTPAY